MLQVLKEAAKSGGRKIAWWLQHKNSCSCRLSWQPDEIYSNWWRKSDFLQALPLIAGGSDAVLAERGYDAGYIVAKIEAIGVEAIIPPKSNRQTSREDDSFLYKERNVIERMFNKMKQFRGIATRYGKTSVAFLGFIQLAAVLLWLK
jgi:putative transposase